MMTVVIVFTICWLPFNVLIVSKSAGAETRGKKLNGTFP